MQGADAWEADLAPASAPMTSRRTCPKSTCLQGIAVAQWREPRADRVEADVDVRHPAGLHGPQPRHRNLVPRATTRGRGPGRRC